MPHAHKRTEANERVVRAMAQVPGVSQSAIAEALGVSLTTLKTHYADLIPHPGPGAIGHVPTAALRQLVANYKAVGLTNEEIATVMDLDRGTLERNYGTELRMGAAIVTAKVGNRVLVRALGNGPEAQRASEFFLNGWKNRVALDLEREGQKREEEAAALVDGRPAGAREPTRHDARKVAFWLSRQAQAQAEPVYEARVVDDEEGQARGV